MDAGTVKCLLRMYTDISASVLIGRDYSRPFRMVEGVRQGCPASPLVFSLYMDRLEGYIRSERLAGMTPAERDSIRVAGQLIPLLLFADDIVLMATSREVVQSLLDCLGAFCGANGLTVSVAKTKWLVGGSVPRGRAWGELYYQGAPLERVSSFKYLGLVFTGATDHSDMRAARLTSARKAWGVLQGKLQALGWRDRATRLVLFEAYVRSVLLYGAPVWGVSILDERGRVGEDRTGPLGVFYRACLRNLLDVGREVRNELLYVLAVRPPL